LLLASDNDVEEGKSDCQCRQDDRGGTTQEDGIYYTVDKAVAQKEVGSNGRTRQTKHLWQLQCLCPLPMQTGLTQKVMQQAILWLQFDANLAMVII
jgi:hypothetical protein